MSLVFSLKTQHAKFCSLWTCLDVFSKEESDKIIEIFQKNKINNAQVGTEVGIVNPGYRKSKIFWLPKEQEYSWIYERIIEKVVESNNEYFNFEISEIEDNIQISEYNSEYKGFYDWHIDVGQGGPVSRRKLSISVQLSDSATYEGGDLEFSDSAEQKTAMRERGAMTVFPSYMRHRVNPVTKGTRYALVVWVAGPPFR